MSNLAITKLFYSHTLKIKGGSLHSRSFGLIHFSVFRYRWSKNGFTGTKSSRNLRETAPWPETLCFYLGKASTLPLTVSLSTQEYKWVPVNCWEPIKLRDSDLRWTSILSRESTVLSIMPKIPEIEVGIQMERPVSVSSDRNIRDHSRGGPPISVEYSDQNSPFHFDKPMLCLNSRREFGKWVEKCRSIFVG